MVLSFKEFGFRSVVSQGPLKCAAMYLTVILPYRQGHVCSVNADGNSFEVTDNTGPPLTVCCRTCPGQRELGEYVLVVGKLGPRRAAKRDNSENLTAVTPDIYSSSIALFALPYKTERLNSRSFCRTSSFLNLLLQGRPQNANYPCNPCRLKSGINIGYFLHLHFVVANFRQSMPRGRPQRQQRRDVVSQGVASCRTKGESLRGLRPPHGALAPRGALSSPTGLSQSSQSDRTSIDSLNLLQHF